MRPNAPVVGISWYEANAYCKWLLANWDELEEGRQGLAKPAEIRLPKEEEWELAAVGTKNKRFAFGELDKEKIKDLPRYANTDESGIGRTTPVWMYPNGASPHQVMDMSGNVWEWQANYCDKDHDYLSWRGGSWYLNQGGARVSYRDYLDPHYRRFSVGFRVSALPSDVFAS
jgi:formylglycine-generating enzyme required for sulfatase activity